MPTESSLLQALLLIIFIIYGFAVNLNAYQSMLSSGAVSVHLSLLGQKLCLKSQNRSKCINSIFVFYMIVVVRFCIFYSLNGSILSRNLYFNIGSFVFLHHSSLIAFKRITSANFPCKISSASNSRGIVST